MRIVYNILIGLMLLGIVAAGAWRAHSEREWQSQIDQTRSELHRIESKISVRTALRDVPMSERGYPLLIDPEWFEGALPRNLLLDARRPWMEIAGQSQADHRHPADPVANEETQAMFWYNPHTGRVRARIPAQASDSASLALYNSVNGTALLEW